MRHLLAMLVCGILVTAAAQAAPATPWQWDNYLTPGAGYDGLTGKSSEWNTRTDNSWTADDMVITEPVELQSISWIGFMENEPGAVFDSVEVLIFSEPAAFPADPDDVINNYAVTGTPIVVDVGSGAAFNDRVGEYFYGLQVYDGEVELPTPITLAPGHYYYSVRVRGNGLGRSYVATTGNGVTAGDTMGAFQSSVFAYPPNTGSWVLVGDLPNTNVTDYAYQLNGVVVPEPMGLVMMAAGVLLAWRRR